MPIPTIVRNLRRSAIARRLSLAGVAAAMLATTALNRESGVAPAEASCLPFCKPDLSIPTAQIVRGPGYGVLKFQIHDSGAAAGPYTIAIKGWNGVVVQTIAVPGMSSGETRAFTHIISDWPNCEAVLRSIVVDSANSVAESNEANNSTTLLAGGPC